MNLDTSVFNNNSLILFKSFLSLNNDKKNNCIFDITSIIRSLYALSKGVNLQEKEKVQHVLKLFAELPTITRSRTGVFLGSNLKFLKSYKKNINTSFSQKFYLGNMDDDSDKINRDITQEFPYWPDKNENFWEKPLSSGLYIKDESIFAGKWDKPFSPQKIWENFDIGEDKYIKVPMMERDNYRDYMLTYEDDANNTKWVSLPYRIDRFMLIIMPNKARTFKELVKFCINDLSYVDIDQFYTVKGQYKLYTTKRMPDFRIESKWELSSNDINNYPRDVLKFFKPHLDLREMCENLVGPVLLHSTCKIHTNENGTGIRTKTQIFERDYYDDEVKEHTLVIDKSFIFVILDTNYKICQIGIYAG